MTDQTNRLAEIRARVEAAHLDDYGEVREVIRQDIPDLLAEVARLSAGMDEWFAIAEHRANSIANKVAELSRLRAVIEEAQARLGDFPARLDHEGLDGMGNEANDVVALLDRGMKGENND